MSSAKVNFLEDVNRKSLMNRLNKNGANWGLRGTPRGILKEPEITFVI